MLTQRFGRNDSSISLSDAAHVELHTGSGKLDCLRCRFEFHFPPTDVFANLAERPGLLPLSWKKSIGAHQRTHGRIEPAIGELRHFKCELHAREQLVTNV